MEQRYTVIAEKVNILLAGEVQLATLAQKIVDLAVKELHLNGAAIFRVSEDKKSLYAFTYSHRARSLVDRFLPKRFSELSIPLATTENFAVRTVAHATSQRSVFLHDFSKHVLSDALVDRVQRVMGAKLYASYPIHEHDGSVIGAMLFGLTEETVAPELEQLFLFFTNQIGAIFSSGLQFDRILRQYKAMHTGAIMKKKEIPIIKFTLRITKRQQNYIRRHIRGSTRTKAKFVRDLLDALIEAE